MAAAAPQETLRRRQAAGCDPWLARAFGVELALDFEAPALRRGEIAGAEDPTTLELVYSSSLEDAWRDDEARPLGWMPDGRGGALIEIREHPTLGVMVAAGRHGRYLIGPGARHVACAPPAVAGWYWQRMLIGQVLPLVAALRGLHVIHASAVALGDHAIAIAGAPGAGKSTLALELALRGHALLAEDVIALRLHGGRAVAEPGVSLVNLRPSDEMERLVAGACLPVLGRSHKIHVDLPRAPHALPLSALYLLEPAGSDTPAGTSIAPVPAPSPRDVIGTVFVPYLSRPEHLLRHLELAAALARTATVARVRIAPDVPPAEVAERIEAHAA
jgi:hypothetical protein